MTEIKFNSIIKGGLPVHIHADYYSATVRTYWHPGSETEIVIFGVFFLTRHEYKQELSKEDQERLEIEAFEFMRDEYISAMLSKRLNDFNPVL